MNARQLLILITVVSVGLALVFLSLLGVYYYDRTLIGFPPDTANIKIDTIYTEPTVRISETRLNELEDVIVQRRRLGEKTDSLEGVTKNLNDSIGSLAAQMQQWMDSVKQMDKKIAAVSSTSATIKDSLNTLESRYTKLEERLKLSSEKLTSQEKFIEKKQDTLEVENFETFAKIYNNAEPQDVARILEQIDERDAAKILKLMQKKKAGKVLEAMVPEQAAAILLLGVGE
ncbi:MAG: magnesium transporter MgtE N-terminal domain-containing protein [Candidatus Kapaibacterium sp.]